jgi:beta-glucosidase
LQDIGGWPNETVAQEFATYARVLYTEFGDRVKNWITFNGINLRDENVKHLSLEIFTLKYFTEPWVVCQLGYAYGSNAPGIVDPAEKPYQCAHTIIKSHGLAYRIYENEFKQQQQGQVGITLNSNWAEPKDASNPDHVAASDRSRRFSVCPI